MKASLERVHENRDKRERRQKEIRPTNTTQTSESADRNKQRTQREERAETTEENIESECNQRGEKYTPINERDEKIAQTEEPKLIKENTGEHRDEYARTHNRILKRAACRAKTEHVNRERIAKPRV